LSGASKTALSGTSKTALSGAPKTASSGSRKTAGSGKVATIRSLSTEVLRLIETRAFEDWQPEKILTWAIGSFHPRLALSASFGAPEGMALLHMMHAIEPASRVFVLDTGRMHEATYDLMDRVRDRYDKEVEIVFPRADEVEEMVRTQGANLFYESLENRKSCCYVRKVAPMRRFVKDHLDAYVSGLRRDQNANRADTPKVIIDAGNGGVVKVNPLADWTRDQVWEYVKQHDVPVNRLHKAGYPSVGCAPCTRAVPHGGEERDGRWWWENDDTKECGLHVTEEQDQGSGI
jgi:phosphoadenosine phosphosulfate reductase